MSIYVVAVKREFRDSVQSDWVNQIQQIEGVEVSGNGNSSRVLVNASPDSLPEIEKRVGSFCHIEPTVTHTTQRP